MLVTPIADGKISYIRGQNMTDSVVFRVNPLISNKGKFNRIFADSANINSIESELFVYKTKSKLN